VWCHQPERKGDSTGLTGQSLTLAAIEKKQTFAEIVKRR
jgi:hypothetical protein